ncbi:MAG: alpha/beta fold hydrolase [Pseudomonadota bacterium]
MKNWFLLTPLLALVLGVAPGAADEVPERTLNNGNLILSDIPEIPASLAQDLNRYENVRSGAFRAWARDGQSLFITTRFGDTGQLHRVAMPGGARQQLTFFSEPVSGVQRQPGGDLISFLMDTGGSEFDQLYLFDPATGKSQMVSDGESRNGSVLWDDKGKLMAFQSTRRNGRSNDIWVMPFDQPASAKVALEAPDGAWWGPAAFSPEGEQLLVQQYVSATSSSIYLVDLASGEKQTVAGGNPDVAGRHLAADFDRGGRGIYYLTDVGSQFARLAYKTLEPGATARIITEDIPWDVTGMTLSDDKTRGAFVVNEEGFAKLYLLDPATQTYRRVEGLPVGIVGGLSFSPDGSALAMTLNTPQSPSDTFVLALKDSPLEHGEVTRWTYSEVGGMDTDKFSVPELVRFPTFDEVDGKKRTVPAFVYKPRSRGPHPVIINIHGGPEGQFRPSFRSTYQLWIDRLGAAVIAPNVRGSAGYGKDYLSLDNGYKREDSVRDIGALLDWIGTQPDLDADRVAVIGGSYGGYMVLASAVHYSDRLRAAVDVVGISSFVTFLENTQAYRRDLRRPEYGDERIPEMREFLNRISPLNNTEKIRVPLFVVQGENDPRVPVTEAEQVVAAVRQQGPKVWYMNALDEGHGYARKPNQDIYRQAVVLFFEQHLL